MTTTTDFEDDTVVDHGAHKALFARDLRQAGLAIEVRERCGEVA